MFATDVETLSRKKEVNLTDQTQILVQYSFFIIKFVILGSPRV